MTAIAVLHRTVIAQQTGAELMQCGNGCRKAEDVIGGLRKQCVECAYWIRASASRVVTRSGQHRLVVHRIISAFLILVGGRHCKCQMGWPTMKMTTIGAKTLKIKK